MRVELVIKDKELATPTWASVAIMSSGLACLKRQVVTMRDRYGPSFLHRKPRKPLTYPIHYSVLDQSLTSLAQQRLFEYNHFAHTIVLY